MEEGRTRTLLLGDARNQERYLRVTWHPDSQTLVFSHWQGPVCAASTPIQLSDASPLVDLLVGAMRPSDARRPLRSAGGAAVSGPHEGGQ